ncbi:hypothetical protein BD414DRAFT_478698 [Trametes punicea]|nr:hypothetical protein BD414DRAFT_478698 [Trametes punicea]
MLVVLVADENMFYIHRPLPTCHFILLLPRCFLGGNQQVSCAFRPLRRCKNAALMQLFADAELMYPENHAFQLAAVPRMTRHLGVLSYGTEACLPIVPWSFANSW